MAITEVTFTKAQYHLNGAMELWCHHNLGPGGRVYSDPGDWEENRKWAMTGMFGNTTFYFKNETDATIFALKWVNQ
jgi:hypothetical protein